MFLQGGVLTKRHSTKAAFETASLLASMSFHVPGQFAALCTRVGTQLTLVWLLPCVTSLVYRQVTAVLENFSAELATVVSSVAQEVFASLEQGCE